MNNEHDFRGYVQDHGWAHSIAHASDTFEALVRSLNWKLYVTKKYYKLY